MKSIAESEPKFTAILLAAGQSKRFGSIKQLAEIKGVSLINHSLTKLLPLGYEILVVLGANAEQIQPRLIKNSKIRVIINTDWQQGIGNSISFAVNEIANEESHLLLALADQVAMTTVDFQHFISSAKDNSDNIICAEYEHTVGVPAIFPKVFFKDLRQLTGDYGAKKVLRNHSAQLIKLPFQRAAIDIDTQQDLLDWMRKTS
jgi:molybdenum cofactor cytidylyltransferase